MITSIIPKLPMRDPAATCNYYSSLGFVVTGDYGDYLLLEKDSTELHFFIFKGLKPAENYGQVYLRIRGIDQFYAELVKRGIVIHPNGPLQIKPWGQKEFSLLDPDHNLLTFGEAITGS